MPDLRYHLVSLISVFLALAIGVLLGTAIADRGVLDEQLRAQIEDVQDRFTEQQSVISERNQRISVLEEQVGAQNELSERMAGSIVSDRLNGYDVAVVVGPYADDQVSQAIQDDLAFAGANIGPVVQLEQPDPEDPEAAAGSYARAALEVSGSASALEQGSLEGSVSGISEAISGNLGSTGLPNTVVFVGGGAPPGVQEVEPVLEFVRAAQEQMFGSWDGAGIQVVAAESSFADNSEVPLYQTAGVSSVDNADLPSGRASLVLLVAGVAEGSYGLKPTATDVFPPLPE